MSNKNSKRSESIKPAVNAPVNEVTAQPSDGMELLLKHAQNVSELNHSVTALVGKLDTLVEMQRQQHQVITMPQVLGGSFAVLLAVASAVWVAAVRFETLAIDVAAVKTEVNEIRGQLRSINDKLSASATTAKR